MPINKDSLNKEIKLALYESTYGNVYARTEDEAFGYCRLSEFVSITFSPRPIEAYIPDALKQIKDEETEALADYHRTLNRLRDRKAALLELTYQPKDPVEVADEGPIPAVDQAKPCPINVPDLSLGDQKELL